MDHLTSKLGAAGMVDAQLMAITTTASAQLTLHTEKVAHITSKLSAAGLDTGTGTTGEVKDTNTGTTPQSISTNTDSSHHVPAGTYAIVGVVVGIILISAAAGIFFVLRQRRRRYGVVGGKQKMTMAEKDVFDADIHEPESEGLQPQEAGLRERHYESGYDNADTHYDGSDYEVKPTLGDKRAQYGA